MCVCLFLRRARRALENRQSQDDDRIEMLEQMVKEATDAANEAERKYDEVCALEHNYRHSTLH